jgi:UDP-N-acetylmuramyl pentapeptide phosphotransferase/UDP-N-acetylglucosamine-1-phosphate transferase
MQYERKNGAWLGWAAMLLPSVVVVMYTLLNRLLPAPTAGGLSFLAVALVAYWFFPKIRLRLSRILAAIVVAVVVAVLMALVP